MSVTAFHPGSFSILPSSVFTANEVLRDWNALPIALCVCASMEACVCVQACMHMCVQACVLCVCTCSYASVCACVCASVCEYVSVLGMCTCVWNIQDNLSCYPGTVYLIFFFFLSLTDQNSPSRLDKLASKSRVLLSLTPQHWVYKHAPLCLAFFCWSGGSNVGPPDNKTLQTEPSHPLQPSAAHVWLDTLNFKVGRPAFAFTPLVIKVH